MSEESRITESDPGSCAFCLRLRSPDDRETVDGLPACPRCREGDLDGALEAHGFSRETRFEERHTSSHDDPFIVQVELSRPPSDLELIVALRRDFGAGHWFTRLFRKPDFEIGMEEFDRLVRMRVDLEYEFVWEEILQIDGVREAIASLVRRHVSLSIANTAMSAGGRYQLSSSRPSVEEVSLHLVALAIHLERFARGPRLR